MTRWKDWTILYRSPTCQRNERRPPQLPLVAGARRQALLGRGERRRYGLRVIAFLLFALSAATPPAPPTGASFASYISDAEYPAEAIRRGEEGLVEFELDVSPQGQVAHCSVTRSSGSLLLDDTTCRLLTARARFRPGRSADGRPTADRVGGHIRWVLPR